MYASARIQGVDIFPISTVFRRSRRCKKSDYKLQAGASRFLQIYVSKLPWDIFSIKLFIEHLKIYIFK